MKENFDGNGDCSKNKTTNKTIKGRKKVANNNKNMR